MKEKKQLTLFQKALIGYSIFLSLLMLIFLIYVGNSLVKYENNQIENYLKDTIRELQKQNDLTSHIENFPTKTKSKFESTNVNMEESIKEILKEQENITYKQVENSTDEQPTFDIYYKENPFLKITLDGTRKMHRLGLLTFSVWEVKNIKSTMEQGLYGVTLEIPSNWNVTINGIPLTKEDKKEMDNNERLEEIAEYVEIPKLVSYEIKGLYKTPEINITDEQGNKVEYQIEENKIKKEITYQKIKDEETAKNEIENLPDILKIARDWSLFLSKDLDGKQYGYPTIKNYLVENSKLQKYAYSWATGVDITFTSSHTLNNPPFTNERIENFEIYNENAFSCEVYLVKHMLIKGSKKLDDTMHDRMYFVRLNNEWKLVNMEAITEGEIENE